MHWSQLVLRELEWFVSLEIVTATEQRGNASCSAHSRGLAPLMRNKEGGKEGKKEIGALYAAKKERKRRPSYSTLFSRLAEVATNTRPYMQQDTFQQYTNSTLMQIWLLVMYSHVRVAAQQRCSLAHIVRTSYRIQGRYKHRSTQTATQTTL